MASSFSLANISRGERPPRKSTSGGGLYGDSLVIVGVADEFKEKEEVTFGVAGPSSTDRKVSLLDFQAVDAGA
jgi:hypothetical protein